MLLISLLTIQTYITQYGMGILLFLGNIGNTFVILIFRQHHKTACSIYLSSAAFINIIYLTFNIPINIYTILYHQSISNSLIFCKLRYYLSHVFGQMARYFIILACFDRYTIININFRQRNYNRPFIAKRLIIFVTSFWCIIGSHQLIFTKIKNHQCGQFGIYYIINNIYLFISFSIIPPILMITFGYLVYNQLKYTRIKFLTQNQNRFIVRRRDRELLIMIFTEVFIYILTMILYLVISLELLLTYYINENKSIQRKQIEDFIMFISIFFIYMNHAAPFYIYIIVSKKFRRDFKKFF